MLTFFLFLTLNFWPTKKRRVITVPISYRPFPKSQNSQKWIFQKNTEPKWISISIQSEVQSNENSKFCHGIEPHARDITSSNDVLSHLKDLRVVAYSCDTFLDSSKVINKMILPLRYGKCRWQWCWWHRYIGDIVVLVTLLWWLIWNVGGRIIMLVTFFVMLVNFSMY